MKITGKLIKEKDWYSILVTFTRPFVGKERQSYTVYPCFDSAYEAVNWFYRVHPEGTLIEFDPLPS